MARETKLGLGLIGLLCAGLVAAIGWRVTREIDRRQSAEKGALAAAQPQPPKTERPKLLLRTMESDRAPGETGPIPFPKQDTGSRAQLVAASEPVAPMPRQRYPLMPASADDRPALSPEETPPSTEPATLPHTSFRPEDNAPQTAMPSEAAPLKPVASPLRPASADRETMAVSGEEPAASSRYRQPAFAPAPSADADATQREPAMPAPRAYRQPSVESRPFDGAPQPRPFAVAPRPEFAAAPDRGDGTATVQPNDTFWTISERVYGTGAYFKALIRYNADKHPLPDQLAVGDTVLVPSVGELRQKYPQLCPKPRQGGEGGIRNAAAPRRAVGGRSYEVREGDTLFDIARFELGDGARWVEIYELNRDQLTDDYHYVKPGSTLQLPGRHRAEPADRIAREPSDVRRQ